LIEPSFEFGRESPLKSDGQVWNIIEILEWWLTPPATQPASTYPKAFLERITKVMSKGFSVFLILLSAFELYLDVTHMEKASPAHVLVWLLVCAVGVYLRCRKSAEASR
jgi:hypothetical protein